jgi:hypothetical protein
MVSKILLPLLLKNSKPNKRKLLLPRRRLKREQLLKLRLELMPQLPKKQLRRPKQLLPLKKSFLLLMERPPLVMRAKLMVPMSEKAQLPVKKQFPLLLILLRAINKKYPLLP